VERGLFAKGVGVRFWLFREVCVMDDFDSYFMGDFDLILVRVRGVVNEGVLELEGEFCVDGDLYAEGLDSMGLMQLMLLLEQEFGVRFGAEDLGRENFGSISAIGKLVVKHLKGYV